MHIIEPTKRGTEYRALMHKHVDEICDGMDDGMAGFIIAGWDMTMGCSSSFRIYEKAPFGLAFIPTFIQDIFRRHIARDEAIDVIHESIGG